MGIWKICCIFASCHHRVPHTLALFAAWVVAMPQKNQPMSGKTGCSRTRQMMTKRIITPILSRWLGLIVKRQGSKGQVHNPQQYVMSHQGWYHIKQGFGHHDSHKKAIPWAKSSLSSPISMTYTSHTMLEGWWSLIDDGTCSNGLLSAVNLWHELVACLFLIVTLFASY